MPRLFCDFWIKQDLFHYHIISKDGVAVHQSKVIAIMDWNKLRMLLKLEAVMDLQAIIVGSLKTFLPLYFHGLL